MGVTSRRERGWKELRRRSLKTRGHSGVSAHWPGRAANPTAATSQKMKQCQKGRRRPNRSIAGNEARKRPERYIFESK